MTTRVTVFGKVTPVMVPEVVRPAPGAARPYTEQMPTAVFAPPGGRSGVEALLPGR